MKRLIFTLIAGLLALPVRAEPSGPEVARGWLRAVQAGEAAAIAQTTKLPFIYREAWPKKQCDQSVADGDALGKWTACMQKNERLLLDELKWEKENLTLEAGEGKSPKKLRALAKKVAKGEWVHGWINGDGVTYEFLFLMDRASDKPQIAACIIDVSFDTD